jgi:hypothetical protein
MMDTVPSPGGDPRPSLVVRFIRLFWLSKQPIPPEGTPERAAYDALQESAANLGGSA